MGNKKILLNNKQNCCGCGACMCICSKSAIKMERDKQGFLFPKVDDDICINCGLCTKTCPMKKQESIKIAECQRPHIKIINLYYTGNYGAIIASMCLEDKVSEIVGDEVIVQTINYYNSISKYRFFKKMYEEIIDYGGIKDYSQKIFKKYSESNGYNYIRQRRFNRFEDKYINSTEAIDNNGLKICNDNNVALICGSDVIWHTKRIISEKSYAFCLKFGAENTKRIAYAPSIDCASGEKILRRRKKYYKNNLSKIDCMSVREADSVKFLQNVTGKPVEQCCDPVLFYDSDYFVRIADCSKANPVNEKYIYAYILDENDYIVEYVKKLSKEKKMKVCFFAPNYNKCFEEGDINCEDDGPSEFLSRVINAEYVVTTSFHCVVFSLIFKKKFLAFSRSETSIKIPDLLNTLNVKNRLVIKNEERNIDDEIDYAEVSKNILQYREKSINFLKDSLADIL